MNWYNFKYESGLLTGDGIDLELIASEVGTPCYVYSRQMIEEAFQKYTQPWGDFPHLICYAVKANSNLSILNLLAKLGAGADIVSGGELYRCERAGMEAKKIIFSGVGKTDGEIVAALKKGIYMLNLESEQEMERVDAIAQHLKVKAPISIRINPDIDAGTHPYITTGMRNNKFGIPEEKTRAMYKKIKNYEGLEVRGLQCHIGSQITKLTPFADTFARLVKLYDDLTDEGINLECISIGGGLGITYIDEAPPSPKELIETLLALIENRPVKLLLEPGRSIVGNAGILLARVLYIKDTGEKKFVILDAAMNDLGRPSLYGAFHKIIPVREPQDQETIKVDIVGPICETTDTFARDREISKVKAGDLVAVLSAGAYGFSMASNYNSRPRAAEVLLDNNSFEIIRRRETYDDLVRGETIK